MQLHVYFDENTLTSIYVITSCSYCKASLFLDKCCPNPPAFHFVQHAFCLLMSYTNQRLLVDGNELISRPQAAVLHKEKDTLNPGEWVDIYKVFYFDGWFCSNGFPLIPLAVPALALQDATEHTC